MGFVYTVPVGFWLGLLAVSFAAIFTSFFYKNNKSAHKLALFSILAETVGM